MITLVDIFKKYKSNHSIFIETGSLFGDGIQSAVDAGFTNIHSIELTPKYFEICTNRFANNNDVTTHFGDSFCLMEQLLKDITVSALFWLDAHAGSHQSDIGICTVPLLSELTTIGKHSIKTHTIIVDDVRCMGKKVWNEVTKEKVVEKLKSINNKYTIATEDIRPNISKDDVMVAYV